MTAPPIATGPDLVPPEVSDVSAEALTPGPQRRGPGLARIKALFDLEEGRVKCTCLIRKLKFCPHIKAEAEGTRLNSTLLVARTMKEASANLVGPHVGGGTQASPLVITSKDNSASHRSKSRMKERVESEVNLTNDSHIVSHNKGDHRNSHTGAGPKLGPNPIPTQLTHMLGGGAIRPSSNDGDYNQS